MSTCHRTAIHEEEERMALWAARLSAFSRTVGRWMGVPVLAIVVLLTGCGAPSSGATMASPTATLPPIHINGVADVPEARTPGEMCHRTLVADATVASLGQARWNTANGARPALDASAIMQGGYSIYTPVLLARIQPFIDRRQDAPHSEIVALGGQVGQDSMRIDPYPTPSVGGRYIVLLVPGVDPAANGVTQRWLVISQLVPIDGQDMVQLQPQTVEQGQVSQEEIKLPLADLTQQLAACG
jgi:hypothetical protein